MREPELHSSETPSVDDLIRALRAPEPPLQPPRIHTDRHRQARLWVAGGLGSALVAASIGLLCLRQDPDSDRVKLIPRGIQENSPASQVELQLLTEQDGEVQRLAIDEHLSQGQPVFFRLSAEPAGRVWIWADGPDGRELIGETLAGPEPEMLMSSAGHVAWSAASAGTYRIQASSLETGVCKGSTCSFADLLIQP